MTAIRCPHCTAEITQDELDNARFDSYVRVSDGCWEWTGARHVFGYGAFGARSRNWGAHRWQWERLNGPVPKGMMVCHTCDNPPCVRPDHLVLGTQKDNMRDKVSRGRHRWGIGGRSGEEHPMAKLDASRVAEIRSRRASGESVRHLSEVYGVHRSTIFKIVRGSLWKG